MKNNPQRKRLGPQIKREVHKFDAKGEILGRLAVRTALLLMGKHKPQFTYNCDWGDQVIVYNIDKVKISGRAKFEKPIYRYTGYPGGIKEKKLGKLLEKNPAEVFRSAVKGMLPENKLRKFWIKRLKVFKSNIKN